MIIEIHLSLMSTELRAEKVFCCKNIMLTNHDENRNRNKIVKGKK